MDIKLIICKIAEIFLQCSYFDKIKKTMETFRKY